MRMPVIGANWKMHKLLKEATDYCLKLPDDPALYSRVEVVVFRLTALAAVGQALKGTGIKLGAQNMHPAEKGAPQVKSHRTCCWIRAVVTLSWDIPSAGIFSAKAASLFVKR